MLPRPAAILALLPLFGAPADAASCGFYAHKNFIPQSGLRNGQYTSVTFSATRFDNCEGFDEATGTWRPPAGVVHLSAQIFWAANATPLPIRGFVVKIFKNGSDVCAGIGHPTTTAGVAVAAASCDDLANGSDVYHVEAYGESATGADDLVIDADPAHTYFSGIN